MESVLVKVVSFIAVIVVGYLLKRVGFFRSEDFRLIAGLVLKVTLPCAIISNFTRIDVDAALLCSYCWGSDAIWSPLPRAGSHQSAAILPNRPSISLIFRATTSAASLFLFCRAS